MKQYQKVIQILFALIFIGGGLIHLVNGQLHPQSYVAFSKTALFSWLSNLWISFVMPNISWLTILLGIYEILCGLGMIQKHTVIVAVWGMIIFLIFITILGYSFPTHSLIEDLLKNRLPTIIMIGLLIPILIKQSKNNR